MLYHNPNPISLTQPQSTQPTLTRIGQTQYGFYRSKMLGEGFGGTIYQGIKITDSSPIAVKILNPNSLIQNHIPLKELIDLTSKNHIKTAKLPFSENSLVQVFDVIQMDKTLIIMQLCQNNLSEFLSFKKTLSEPAILQILKNIIQALITVQNYGYHFSDLKPQNILITKDGIAKLGDLESLIMLHTIDKNVKLKFHNSIFGTLRYMPPQLIGLGEHCAKNYIWSLGVILHQIIYDSPPFQLEKYHPTLTQQQKVISLNNFYSHLFRLQISQTLAKDYPKCHLLFKKMLRFNAKNRIDLHKIIDIIQDSNNENSKSQIGLCFFQTKMSRSNSQNTIDTTDEYKNEPRRCSMKLQKDEQKWQNSKVKWRNQDQKYQNQKQVRPCNLESKPCDTEKEDKIWYFIERLKQKYENQTLKLIQKIQRPMVLVRKLNNLTDRMRNLMQRLDYLQKSKNQKDHQLIVKSIWHEIRVSKVYSHLQMTIRIQNLDVEFDRNHKQVTLWNHLNQIIQMARLHLISCGIQ